MIHEVSDTKKKRIWFKKFPTFNHTKNNSATWAILDLMVWLYKCFCLADTGKKQRKVLQLIIADNLDFDPSSNHTNGCGVATLIILKEIMMSWNWQKTRDFSGNQCSNSDLIQRMRTKIICYQFISMLKLKNFIWRPQIFSQIHLVKVSNLFKKKLFENLNSKTIIKHKPLWKYKWGYIYSPGLSYII